MYSNSPWWNVHVTVRPFLYIIDMLDSAWRAVWCYSWKLLHLDSYALLCSIIHVQINCQTVSFWEQASWSHSWSQKFLLNSTQVAWFICAINDRALQHSWCYAFSRHSHSLCYQGCISFINLRALDNNGKFVQPVLHTKKCGCGGQTETFQVVGGQRCKM